MKYFFLLSTAVIMTTVSMAGILPFSTHTHTNTPIELTSISPLSGKEIKLASVCFLGSNCDNDGVYDKGNEDTYVDTSEQCKNEGFVSSCTSGYCMDGSCPYNKSFGACLTENCPTNSATSCTGAVTGKSTCGIDCKQCCTATCSSGFSNYTTANIPNGYVQDGSETCDKCGVGKVIKIKPNPCDGYQTCQYGAVAGASSCLSGSTTKYSSCKTCTPTCTSVSSCPSNYQILTKSDGCGGSCRYCYCFKNTCTYWADAYTVAEIEWNGRTYHNVCYSPKFWTYTCQGKSFAGARIMTSSCESLGSYNTMFCD